MHASVQISQTGVEILFSMLSVAALAEDSAAITVELTGMIERDVSFLVESLDSLDVMDYATAGRYTCVNNDTSKVV